MHMHLYLLWYSISILTKITLMAKNLLQASEGRLRKGSISVNISPCPQKYIMCFWLFWVCKPSRCFFGLEFRSKMPFPNPISCLFLLFLSSWKLLADAKDKNSFPPVISDLSEKSQAAAKGILGFHVYPLVFSNVVGKHLIYPLVN